MNEDEFRKYLLKNNSADIDAKVGRWKQLEPFGYNKPMPNLLWEYVTIANDMYIDGHFLGTILLSAAIVERTLVDQLMLKTQMSIDESERFNSNQVAILCFRTQIIDEKEKETIDKLRRLRNSLVHVNADKLSKITKQSNTSPYEGLDSEFYLFPLSDKAGIRADALKYLDFTKDLTVKFYGPKHVDI